MDPMDGSFVKESPKVGSGGILNRWFSPPVDPMDGRLESESPKVCTKSVPNGFGIASTGPIESWLSDPRENESEKLD